MLRVGLTGELGSGKTTFGHMLGQRGAMVLSSDEIARHMMQPAEPIYRAIIDHFGRGVLLPGGSLNRKMLADLAFDPVYPRVEELNAIVHPPVIAEQERRIERITRDTPDAIVIIESALIFTTKYAGEGPWERRFDRVIIVTAPDDVKIARYVERMAFGRSLPAAEREVLEYDARRRLAAQRIPEAPSAGSILVENTGDLSALERRADEIYAELAKLTRAR